MQTKKQKFNKIPLALAMMIIATGQVGVSIYLPSLPLISHDLGVSASSVQFVVTFFLLGFGVSQLFYGPFSDAIGRRPVFLLGQSIYLVGTLVCFLSAHNFDLLIFGRLLQGLGAGSASVLGRSVIRDSYHGSQLIQAMSYISITASILPILSPVIGGWVSWNFGWNAVFLLVLIYILAIFILGYFILPETMPYKVTTFKPLKTLKNYCSLAKNYQVVSSASYNWITYLSTLVSVSLLPFLLQQGEHLTSAEYGQLMIIPSIGLLTGSLLLNTLNKHFSFMQLIFLSASIMIVSGSYLMLTNTSTFSLITGFTLLTLAQGICFPLSITLLLGPHKKQVGAVSAFAGAVQMCLAGTLGGFLIKHFVYNQDNLGFFYIITGVLMILVLLHRQHHEKNKILNLFEPET